MELRQSHIRKLAEGTFDVLVIGGGINGAVSAAALSGKGARVALIDRCDYGGLTSSNSSNLAWGGIKYLESYDIALVRQLCRSRNQLIKHYPSTVQEIPFFAAVTEGFHHPIKLWLATWLYWAIGNFSTQRPRFIPRHKIQQEEPIVDSASSLGAVEYCDAYFHDNDSRFVFNFVRCAISRGCKTANYVESLGAQRQNGIWTTKAMDMIDNRRFAIKSRVLINAAGPFVDAHNQLTGQATQHHHIFSKGIHLIVDRLTPNRRVLTFFADDGRLFFAIPMGNKTCIGTTDTQVSNPLVDVTAEDRTFVLDNINKRLRLQNPLTPDDVISTRCGVRPLAVKQGDANYRDFLQLSRKHAIDVNDADAHLSIFGGKLTDCINVGNEVCGYLGKMGIALPYGNYKWYGEPNSMVKEEFFHEANLIELDSYPSPESSERLSTRLWRRYGAQAFSLLQAIREDPRQADILIKGTEYIRCEIYQAAHAEMVTKLEDFLLRRSKIALVTREQEIRNAPGLMEACQILFGDRAQEKFDEYFSPETARRCPTPIHA